MVIRAGYDTEHAIAYDDLNVPPGWRAGLDPNRRRPRSCHGAAQMVCEQEYLTCKLYSGPANDAETKCLCAQEFYGICLREAGCAAERCANLFVFRARFWGQARE